MPAPAGTRIIIDRLIGKARPSGYFNQPKSHNAVAACVARGRADWGVAIAPAGKAYGPGFLPIAEEHYDFAIPRVGHETASVAAFVAALCDEAVRRSLAELGFTPAPLPKDGVP
jgi:putative molybdopterin biosynthesis protein